MLRVAWLRRAAAALAALLCSIFSTLAYAQQPGATHATNPGSPQVDFTTGQATWTHPGGCGGGWYTGYQVGTTGTWLPAGQSFSELERTT